MRALTFEQTILVAIITAVITVILNGAFHYLKNKLDWFVETKKFKRDYYYLQLKELYICVYSIIAQSEYLRYFHEIEEDIEEIPFLQIEKKKYHSSINFAKSVHQTDEYTIKDAITEFNKHAICETIIGKSNYASKDLLKLAVAHRYVCTHYMDETIEKELLHQYRLEELRLIHRIVRAIIKETNEYSKVCNMNYNKYELANGVMDSSIYRDDLRYRERRSFFMSSKGRDIMQTRDDVDYNRKIEDLLQVKIFDRKQKLSPSTVKNMKDRIQDRDLIELNRMETITNEEIDEINSKDVLSQAFGQASYCFSVAAFTLGAISLTMAMQSNAIINGTQWIAVILPLLCAVCFFIIQMPTVFKRPARKRMLIALKIAIQETVEEKFNAKNQVSKEFR